MDDITATLRDLNPEDLVFRVGAVLVKVKTVHDDLVSWHGQEVYRVSGALCRPDGKALLREDGAPKVHPLGRHLVVQSGSAVDLAAALLDLRQACVDDTIRAEDHYQRRLAPGVASASALLARKATPASNLLQLHRQEAGGT